MKNPYYEAQPVVPEQKDEHQDAFLAAEKYLITSKGTEEIAEAKLRATHPKLADDKVWSEVKARLEQAKPTK
jgi:hypothetical protein